MILKAFAVRDTKGECFSVPYFLGTTGLAVRAFTQLVNDPNTTVSKFPQDYVLYEIGTFDDLTGVLEAKLPPVTLGFGTDFKEKGISLAPGPFKEG